ncbi:MAG: permease-like cell division protein FtsX, partial [Alistipes sp.]|nr:permease-like cell division protein FtsX [Alistipes sp.]
MENDKRIRRKVLSSYIVSTVSIALVLFLLGSVGYMLYSAASTARNLKDNITLSVELDDDVQDEDLLTLESEIKQLSGVTSITYSDKEQKISDEEFRAMFDAEIEGILDENPLRNSLEVAITSLRRADMDAIVAKISAMIMAEEEPSDRAMRALLSHYSVGVVFDSALFVSERIYGDALNRLVLVAEVCGLHCHLLDAIGRSRGMQRVRHLAKIPLLANAAMVAEYAEAYMDETCNETRFFAM